MFERLLVEKRIGYCKGLKWKMEVFVKLLPRVDLSHA
jgi:hypothetical protein